MSTTTGATGPVSVRHVPREVRIAAEQLSCYTANLAVYLAGCGEEPLDRIACSVRLGVRTDLPGDDLAFSHHELPLDKISTGKVLRYASANQPDDALKRVEEEVTSHGQALVVTDSASMPWSLVREDQRAPHFLLVDGRRGDDWHIVDRFSALLADGEQTAFEGWVADSVLAQAMVQTQPFRREQRLRNAHAFGFPVPLPQDGTFQWLSCTSVDHVAPAQLDGTWLTAIDDVLCYLKSYFTRLSEFPRRALFFDDMWAAAQHHAFRYEWFRRTRQFTADDSLLKRAVRVWQSLPSALRFASDSARRGRPRTSLVEKTFDELREVERATNHLRPVVGVTSQTNASVRHPKLCQ